MQHLQKGGQLSVEHGAKGVYARGFFPEVESEGVSN
jgi:hypothetical protein